MSSRSSRGRLGNPGKMTRRSLLTTGATTLAAAAAIGAEASAQSASAPAIQSGTNAGRRFRGFVRHGTGVGLEDLRLKAIQPRQVVVRTEAAAPCYTSVRGALGTNQARRATIPNHCGQGVVEAVGPEVRRVQRGDRVVIAGTSQCGACYQCLQGRPDHCQFTSGGDDFPPFAEMTDGTPVYGEAGIGGFSELMVVYEEYCVPVFTDVPPAELCLLGAPLTSGFAAGTRLVKFEPGSDVVVFGAGPVGVGAIQAGRVMSATQVIVVEPIKYRRDFAMKMGATAVLDPNVEGANIVERIREMCKGPTDRRFAGGVSWVKSPFSMQSRGADF